MNNLKINYLAVLVSVVWMFFLGFLWYGPLFGEAWLGMVGMDMATAEANPPGASIWMANIFASAMGVYALAWVCMKMGVESAVNGLMTGAFIGIAFNLLPGMVNGFFAQAPYGLAWIQGGFQVIGWSVAGVILGAWRKYA